MERFVITVVLLASVKVADAGRTGACCLPNGSCALLSSTSCTEQNGISRGNETCIGVACSGACCLPNGSCSTLSSQTCTAQPGEFKGFGSQCANQVCGGACCHANGSCALSNESSCASPSTFNGLGSECATSVCAGACCLTDKSCTETGPAGCASVDGLFQGLGTICGDDCPLAMPTAFTYQGQLKRGGLPLNGPIDARFSLWLSPTGEDSSNQIGGTLLRDGIEVANGLFSVELDFGQNAFSGNARWLQIEVRGHDDPPGSFTLLSPRQPLTPSPYSLETRGIVVLDNGDVGIGTKTPFAKLHVKGFGEGLHIEGPFVGSENSAWVGFYDANQTPIGYVGDLSVGDSSVYLASDTGDVHLYTNASPTVTAKANGNVGIGTTAPAAKLDVSGDTRISGSLTVNSGQIQIPATFRSYTLHGFEFMPSARTESGFFYFEDGLHDESGVGGGVANDFLASPHLPDGATLRAMELIGDDKASLANIICRLGRTNFNGGTLEMARVESLTGGNVWQVTDILFPTIDNETHAYWLHVRMNGGSFPDFDHRLTAVRLVYEIAQPLP